MDGIKTREAVVTIQENGIIREGGKIVGRESTESVETAMDIIKRAMVDDNPSERGSYAHAWHCNIAMMCYDAIIEELGDNVSFDALSVANESASRFMKICFDIETKQ